MSIFNQHTKRPEVTEYRRSGIKVLEVDTVKATYQGIPWLDLGAFGKRKYDNLLFIENSHEQTKIIYV